MALVVRTADTLFFNHTFALHRPMNGATMTNANATLIVITIKTSPFSSLKVFKTLQG
jgi:phage terminase large subunit-like protein